MPEMQPQSSNRLSPAYPNERPGMKVNAPQTPDALQSKYRFIRELGHGTQGKVFLAKNLANGSRVAVKQLRIESVKNWKAYDLFKRESDVLADLQIDGIARFYESIECLDGDSPCAWIVQEYIPGRSLQDLLRQGHRFDVHTVYDIALQVLEILKNLHTHVPPIIHRDIKPSNLLLVPRKANGYKVYLIDFGAVANPQIQGGGSTVAGTYGYMAPEQLMGKPGPACDIYALAAVLVYMMCGVSPADMPVKDFLLIFEPEMQSAHPSVVKVLRQMLEPKAEERLADIEQLKTIFTQFKNDEYLLKDISNLAECSSLQLNNKLRDIREYGEAGNIELWQRLSEKTPRAIPECCESVLSNTQQFELDDLIVSAQRSELFTSFWGKLIGYPILAILSPLILGTVTGGGVGIFIEIVILAILFYFFPSTTLKGYCIAAAVMCVLIIIGDLSDKSDAKVAKKNWLNQIRQGIKTRRSANDFEGNEQTISQTKKNIIEKGRKTIARITSIEYVPCERYMIKFNNEYKEFGMFIIKSGKPEMTPQPESQTMQTIPEPETTTEPQAEPEPASPKPEESSEEKNTWSGFAQKEYESGQLFKKDFPIGNTQHFATESSFHIPEKADKTADEETTANQNGTQTQEEEDHLFFAVYYGAPTFKISYAFNPPDDVREEDIIHECYIHYDPEDHLKVGDALPILYLIERVKEDISLLPDSDGMYRQNDEEFTHEYITSMPFPFPMADPIDERDILCCSIGK
ncbi:MAG: protein kinase [Proteobacteria bacterium]|nr:protein kinase [Pseudomonadota bacterium]